ncbi:ribose transport system ATP-binding protein [Angulomicrobium tetraedrale]|uniref:Ribose transport system ATP-binding protein n=1 Tax=Ancylobacter tetraedralis TaxID=217068 RepID=A0A839ZA61_9HYPH|nr:sugar ABC transporter ATP-binding protein [Ancylobacter tetraedralis]MBB3771619.1 ribose transport system ATP-binding protein [Ancylobacter tetraedralis]
MHSAFEVRDLSKSFGHVYAVRGVSLRVKAGEVVAVIGENGAGKSSLMSVICGRLTPTAGEIRIDDQPVHFASPSDAQRAGIAIAPQEINLAADLTVIENVMLGRQVARGGFINWRATEVEARRHIAALDPTIDPQARAGSITVAQQQLVQIARATATGARLLIFDEPTAALTEREAERLFAFIRRFRQEGGLVLYISHRLDEILALADRITVLRDGRHIADLDPQTTSKEAMIRAMAGRDVEELNLRAVIPSAATDEVVMEVRDLSRPGEFTNVSFDLHRGEILGIGGLIGAGRTETVRCLFGDTPRASGTVKLFGRDVAFAGPADAIAAGLVYLPEERRRDGLFPDLSVAENIVLPNLAKFASRLGIRWLDAFGAADRYVNAIPVKVHSSHQLISELSGGNQQKCILARWMMSKCRILMLDEPTRGIDVNAKWEIQKLLRQLARDGLSVIYISSELQEVIDVCDRVMLMHEGRVRAIVPTEGATQEKLLGLAMK